MVVDAATPSLMLESDSDAANAPLDADAVVGCVKLLLASGARVDEVDRRRQSVRARMPRSDRAREAPMTDCANRAAAAASRCVDAIAQSRARVGAFAGSLADEPTTVCWRLAHVRRSMARKSPN